VKIECKGRGEEILAIVALSILFSQKKEENKADKERALGMTKPKKRTVLFDNLMFPQDKDGKQILRTVLSQRQKRPLFSSSPNEREINVLGKSGRQLSEIEILQSKHQPEFEQIVPSIVDAIEGVLLQHALVIKASGDSTDPRLKPFETSQKPNIGIEEYVWRIVEYSYTSPATLLTSLIYLDRLMTRYDALMTPMNIYKLFFISVRIASKVIDLRTLNNKNFANIGGINNKSLNELEASFIILLQFDVFVSPVEFKRYSDRLVPTVL